MPRGGKRNGTPGASYPNRTDLQAPKAPAGQYTGQTYGTAVAQQQAQRAVPVQAPSQPGGLPTPPEGAVKAGSMGDLLGAEGAEGPVTAGAPLGPGPGMEALGLVNPELDATRRDFAALAPYVPTFLFHASRAGASPSYVAWVQRLLAGA